MGEFDTVRNLVAKQLEMLAGLQKKGYGVAYRPTKSPDQFGKYKGVVVVRWNDWKNRLWPIDGMVQEKSSKGPIVKRSYPNAAYVTHKRKVDSPTRPRIHGKPIVHLPPQFFGTSGDPAVDLYIHGPGYQIATLAHELVHAFGPQLGDAGYHTYWKNVQEKKVDPRAGHHDWHKVIVNSSMILGNLFWTKKKRITLEDLAIQNMENVMRIITNTKVIDE